MVDEFQGETWNRDHAGEAELIIRKSSDPVAIHAKKFCRKVTFVGVIEIQVPDDLIVAVST